MPDRSEGDETGLGTPPGLPRWVKVSGIAAVTVIVLLVVLLVTGGPGEHGPGRHSGGDDDRPPATVPGGHMPPEGVPGHVPPADAH